MAKAFSLKAFVNDLIEGLPGPELSWEFKVEIIQERVTVRIPIRLYGDRKTRVRELVLDTAKKHGFTVASLYLNHNYDLVLERYFSDITAE